MGRLSAFRTGDDRGPDARYPIPLLLAGWAGAFVAANILASIIFGASGEPAGEEPMWVVGLVALAMWVPLVVVLVSFSSRFGTGNFSRDYALSFRPSDLLGVPIGIASQLLLVNLVYWPLREWFPDTFNVDKVEDRARGLFDRADGAWILVLIVVVVVGAPIIEELVYRGFIQGSLQGRLSDGVALLLAAAWFTLIHFTPVEFPGLFAFALVLGLCFHGTRRLGLPIVAHMAFNATGLILVAGS